MFALLGVCGAAMASPALKSATPAQLLEHVHSPSTRIFDTVKLGSTTTPRHAFAYGLTLVDGAESMVDLH